MKKSRRKFIKNTVSASTATFLAPSIISASVFGANDRINAVVLGVNGRGKNHISSLMKQKNVHVTKLCDPDKNLLIKRQREFKNKYNKDVSLEQDLRKVMDDKDIDVVSIASPNHWHALSVIWACQAGKDVYVEKPGSHNIFEGRKMVEAAQKYDRIVQHGVQLRSSPAINEAIGLLRDGYIGNVYMARGLVFRWRGDIGDKGFSSIPKGLDYDLWTGPAPKRPFTENLVHYNWHWHWVQHAVAAPCYCGSHCPHSEKYLQHRREILGPSRSIEHRCTTSTMGCNNTRPRSLDAAGHCQNVRDSALNRLHERSRESRL